MHLNSYKINNPTLLSRIPHEELESLFIGYGWKPYFVEGDDTELMHQQMAATLDICIKEIKAHQQASRASGKAHRVISPMIVLRSPKGWTGPKEVDENKVEGFWRAHQVPLKEVRSSKEQLIMLEAWLKSYRPEELFNEDGSLSAVLQDFAPKGNKRMSARSHSNGGILKRNLKMPDFRSYAAKVENAAKTEAMNTKPLEQMLRDIMKMNSDNFRVFGPDENSSNKLDAIYEVSKKC